jgi:glycosyltransferase involved in cell wall biosynthesis
MPKQKKVSILLSCYGGDTLIAGYVDAILANNYLDHIQIVVVNIVTSHKNAAYVHEQFQRLGAHLTQIDLSENISLYEAWNLAIKSVGTKYVCNLNLDDRVTTDYFKVGIALMDSMSVDVFSSNCVITSDIGNWSENVRRTSSLPIDEFGEADYVFYGIDKLLYLDGKLGIKKNSIPHCSPIWRRDLHDQFGFFDCKRFDFCADYEFWLRLAAAGCKMLLYKGYMTLFYMGQGTVSDRLIYPDSATIVEKWTPAFDAQYEAANELGRHHDLLHFAFNHEAAFADRRYHVHLPNRVTVCMPTHVVNSLVEQAIASILAQSYQNIEIVIVLDGICNQSAIEKHLAVTDSDIRIKIVSSHNRIERSNCRNMAIALASGEWIMMMDSDDLLEPDALKNLLQPTLQDRDSIWLGNELVIDENNIPINTIRYSDTYELADMKYGWPSHGNTLWPSSLLKISKYPATYTDSDIRREEMAGEDVEFMVSILRNNPGQRMRNCGKITYNWRRHVSCSYSKRYLSIFSVIMRLVRLFCNELNDPLFCKKMADRCFDCYIWFTIDTVINGKADAVFLQKYSELLAEKLPSKVLEQLLAMANSEVIGSHVQSILKVNRSIMVGVEESTVYKVALTELPKLLRLKSEPLQLSPIEETNMNQTNQHAQFVSDKPVNLSYDRIGRFHNYHKGQDCLLMCNGPSLRHIDFSRIDRSKIVLFGLNKIYLAEDFIVEMPRYVAAVNSKVVQQSESEYQSMKSIKFLSNRYISSLLNEDPMTFYINTANPPKPIPRFSMDVTKYANEGWTVTHVALQIIFHMGFQRVFIVGLDHKFSLGIKGQENTESKIEGDDPDHFHPAYFGGGQTWDLPDLVNSEISYRAALEAYTNAGRSIINCTPGTDCDIFPVESPEILYKIGNVGS